MNKINFKKLINGREISSAIREFSALSRKPIALWDARSNLVLGEEPEDPAQRYPVELEGEVLGWVAGDENAPLLASLVSLAALREYEKKAQEA